MVRLPFLARKPESGSGRLCPVGSHGRDRQFYLCSGSGFAPDVQGAAELLGALAHPGKAPVSGTASSTQYRCVDAYSTISNTQGKLGFTIANLCFYAMCACVPKCISQ